MQSDALDPELAKRKALQDQLDGPQGGDLAGFSAPPIAPSAPVPTLDAAGPASGSAAAATELAQLASGQPTAPRTSTTTLMEGDPRKLADPSHIAKSPKYQFLSEATKYGRGQEGELLKALQSQYGQYWNGVTFDGKGNFDVGNTDPAWDGVRHVDAYGGYNDGGNLRARWGVEDPHAAAQAPQPSGGGGGGLSPELGGDATARIRAELDALINGGQSPATRQAIQALLERGA
jgi:hypothetical protein